MSSTLSPPRTKVRKTLTLDDDLVQTFSHDDPDGFSAAVNAVLRAEQDRRARLVSLRQLADDLDAQCGPADPDGVAQATAIIRGYDVHNRS